MSYNRRRDYSRKKGCFIYPPFREKEALLRLRRAHPYALYPPLRVSHFIIRSETLASATSLRFLSQALFINSTSLIHLTIFVSIVLITLHSKCVVLSISVLFGKWCFLKHAFFNAEVFPLSRLSAMMPFNKEVKLVKGLLILNYE